MSETQRPHLSKKHENVLLVSEPMLPGGMTNHALSLMRGLREVGVAPRLATSEAPPENLVNKNERSLLGVFPGMSGSWIRPFAFSRLVTWAKTFNPSLIHGLSAFTAPICRRLAQTLQVPCVLSVSHYQQAGQLRADGGAFQRILACSEPIRENLVNRARVPKELIRIVPLGINLPDLVTSTRRLEGAWAMVATFAPLTQSQDLETFLRAAKKIHETRLGAAQFLVVGDGPEESSLHKYARELRLEKHLVFSHANVPHDQILPDVDVYVQTARQEGFGVSMLEALGWGLPVVATATGGQVALVQEGITGYLVPQGDHEAVAEKVLDLLGKPKLRARMGAAGRALASERFAMPKVVDAIVETYAEVLGIDAHGPVGTKTTIIAKPQKL